MCLILFAYRFHPDYRLILAANRDEFYDRPTQPAVFWEDVPEILAGRDLKAGGTWMGITRTGRFAAITNYRETGVTKEDAPSRGGLVKDYLTGNSAPHDYLKTVQAMGQNYNGFNLIIGDEKDLFYYANRDAKIRAVKPGMHGLSNHLLDTPWPKIIQGTSRLQSLIANEKGVSQEALFDILADRSTPANAALPDTGVGIEWEKILAPVFITSDIYGTRSSSILLWEHTGAITFLERTFDGHLPDKTNSKTQHHVFTLRS